MPTVPTVRQDDWNGVQIPTVMSADSAPLARGGQALARGLADTGQAAAHIAGIMERVRERKIQDEVTALVDSWRAAQIRTWDGGPGDGPGAEPVRGVKDWGEGDGSATDAMRAAWQTWRDDQDGPYAKASPEARRRADRVLMADTARAFSLAAQKDVALSEARRRTAAEASLATAERAASMYARDDALFTAAAADAADQAARLKLGRLIANPGEADPEKLVFKTEDGAALYAAVRADALDRLRHGRARTLARDAGVAGNEADAASGIAAAARVAETLPPDLRADALAELETVRAKRLDGMLGLARAERDLDKRERLADAALAAAKSYGAGGRLLGAVTEEAGRIRAAAQAEENRLALAALAEGREYDPGENPRMLEALKTAKPKYEAALAKSRQKTLTGNAEYIGAMIGAGAWVTPEGEVAALDLDQRRELLRAQLDAGNIRIPDYLAQKSRLDKIETSGRRQRYERAAADVSAALAEEIKTLWTDGGARLAAGEDPARKILDYTVTETKRELVPEVEEVNRGYTGGILFGGGPSKVRRETGRLVERETVVKRKRELLASDVAKVIDLLMAADDADGLMADLDGNPATPHERIDARAYKARLIGDIKARQLAVDLDTQAAAIYDALSGRRAEQAVLEARAVTRAAGLGLASGTGTEDDDLEDDDAD